MHHYYQHSYKCPSLNQTSASFLVPQNRINSPGYVNMIDRSMNPLASVNYRLMNQITDSETEKNFYRTRLTEEYHTHHNELQNTFSTISQKNQFIIQLQQQLDRMSKDYRVLSDQYVSLKNSHHNQLQLHKTETQSLQRSHLQHLQQLQSQAQTRTQKLINQRIHQIESQCQKRVRMFKCQWQESRENSTQLGHQLSLLRQSFQQLTVTSQLSLQQSLQRQLRSQDFQQQNSRLEGSSQRAQLRMANQQLKQEILAHRQKLASLGEDNRRLNNANTVLQTKLRDLEDAFQYEKDNNRVRLEQKCTHTQEIETNTEQGYVPVVLPVQMNLVGEVQALREFLQGSVVGKYEAFFVNASLKEKRKSASFITFGNFLAEERKNSTENTLLMHVLTGLERIVKLYCPAMSYSREQLTLKDEFVRKTVIQCQGLHNKQQKLFRLLQLIHRLHHPITHIKCAISTGQIKLVQLKIISTLKKIFSSK